MREFRIPFNLPELAIFIAAVWDIRAQRAEIKLSETYRFCNKDACAEVDCRLPGREPADFRDTLSACAR
jgi:hypothetical protein